MAADDFFARWSKRRSTASSEAGVPPADATPLSENIELPVTRQAIARPLPTQDDVAKLTHDSDFSVFMAQGVDEGVKRSAMKKLFSDPHFNVMDGLDTYIEDYTKFTAMAPAVLASLNHAKALLDPLSQFRTPLMKLLETPEETEVLAENTAVSDQTAEPVKAISDTADEEKHYAEEQKPDESKESDTKPDTSDG